MINRLITFVTCCFIGIQLSAQSPQLRDNWWRPDGLIHSIVKDTIHDLVYIGGNFSSVNPPEEFGAQIDYSTGAVDFQFANPNGAVTTSIPDGSGGWYIGGLFTSVGDSSRNYIAHINHLGEVTPWNPNVGGQSVLVIQQSGSTLYIGGFFTSIGGQPRNNVGAIDINTGSVLPWNPSTSNLVKTIAITPSTIYLGGPFTSVNGQARNRIAAVDYAGTLLPWNPNSNAQVNKIIVFGSKLYVGGEFTSIGGQTRNRIASIDLSSGTLNPWNPNVSTAGSQVNDFEGVGSSIYIGGFFSNVGGQVRRNVAAIDTLTGQVTPWNPNIVVSNSEQVLTIKRKNNAILLGGSFRKIGTETHNYFVAVDEVTGQLVNNQFNTKNSSGVIYSINVQGDKIYMGGNYHNVGGLARTGLAVLDANTGALLPWDPRINDGLVQAVVVNDSLVYAGGSFTSVNGQAYTGLVAFDRITASPSSWNPSPNLGVSTLAISGNDLFVGGGFTSMAGQPRSRLASFDLSTHTLNSWNPSANNDIGEFAFVDSIVYISGYFTTINGITRKQIASVNRTTGQLTTWNPNLQNGTWATDIILRDSMIYIGGNFTQVNGVDRMYLCEVNRITGSLSSWNPNIYVAGNSSPANGVRSIERTNDFFFIGGLFGGSNMQVRYGFMVLDNQTNYPTSTNLQILSYCAVVEIYLDSNEMYLGGDFTNIYDKPVNNFASFNVCQTSYTTINDTATCSYTWNNTVYNQSGTYSDTLSSVSGCDSICTLNLLIENSESINVQQTCAPYLWTDGNTYTTSGTYTQSLTNVYGCDSSAVLVLTILTPTYGLQLQEACIDYTWPVNGNTYLFSGLYNDTILNVNGCDSIVTLNLTINHPSTSTQTAISCNDYIWALNSQTYTATGSYTDTILNVNGCDSIVTLNLTINNPTFSTQNITSCNDYLWAINNQTYLTSGSYSDTLTNVAGCDSIVTLNLTIVPSVPLSVNTFSLPSDDNSCLGLLSVSTIGEPDFTEIIDGGSPVTHSGYTLVENLCPGVHSLLTTNGCGDTLTSLFVIPVDSNYVFNNPFIDSIAVDSLGSTIENCEIYYNSIDTAFIDSIFANGNTVTVIWNIVDSSGSNFDTSSYVLNNGNGVYYLQLSVFCPTRAIGDYFTVTEAIYFEDGDISTADLSYLDDNLFELFPNPTNDRVTIRFEAQDAGLVVYDTQGKRVTSQKIQSGETISLANVAPGVYLFEFNTIAGKTVKRVVKR